MAYVPSETSTPTHHESTEVAIPEVMPLLEEQLIASSIAKMAEGAAKQIYNIRETRLNILAGDVEHTPADGKAMQLVLEELKKQEEALTALFVGKKTITHLTKTLYYTPDQGQTQSILARFSRYSGVVDVNDLSGEPIHISVASFAHSLQRHEMMEDKKALLPSQIYYNLPGSADIKISYKNSLLHEASYAIAQYGVSLPLAKDLFIKHKPTIYFNTATGNTSSIQK